MERKAQNENNWQAFLDAWDRGPSSEQKEAVVVEARKEIGDLLRRYKRRATEACSINDEAAANEFFICHQVDALASLLAIRERLNRVERPPIRPGDDDYGDMYFSSGVLANGSESQRERSVSLKLSAGASEHESVVSAGRFLYELTLGLKQPLYEFSGGLRVYLNGEVFCLREMSGVLAENNCQGFLELLDDTVKDQSRKLYVRLRDFGNSACGF